MKLDPIFHTMAIWKYLIILKTIILSNLVIISTSECLNSPLNSTEVLCPDVCCCEWINRRHRSGEPLGLKADCSRRNLTSVPAGLSDMTTELNLGYNSLSKLPPGAFSSIPSLKELILNNNGIETLHKNVLQGLEELQILKLEMNSLKEVPQIFDKGLKHLHYISFDDNQIESIPPGSFNNIPSLQILSVDYNLLSSIPTEALSKCPNLRQLGLGGNKIEVIPDNAFRNNSLLANLVLHKNMIQELSQSAFAGLVNLTELIITGNPITTVDHRTFSNLPSLEELMLSSVKALDKFPDLEGSYNLDRIILDRCSISYVPEDLCDKTPKLRKLDLHSNALTEVPYLGKCSKLAGLHLGINKIKSLEGRPFGRLSAILDLTLKSNQISKIPEDAFANLTKVEYLDLSDNNIEDIHEDAFASFTQLHNLNLAHNRFPYLPTKGLKNLLILQTAHNEHLHEIPSPTEMPAIERVVTAYPYHCCEYIGLFRSAGDNKMTETHSWLNGYSDDFDMYMGNGYAPGGDDTDQNQSSTYDLLLADYSFLHSVGSISYISDLYYGDLVITPPPNKNVSCKPQPDPFMPCSDLFGSWFLRVGVWLVFLLSLIGNVIVILVIVFSRTKIDVSRFLICNLACADFAMGIYLGFLAGVDAATLGVFRKYGVDWQLSKGCGAASFLAVFSSELSIFTLCVITLERFYAIKHALHLEKRLKLKHAMVIMCFGWIFALVVASLPLFGVNSYYRYAVCLPFDISTAGALAYVSGLMLMNGFAFLVIMACYINIYCAIQGSHAWNCNDSRVARRMSLLVFTDFACWAPIAFFGLTSAFHLDLISLYGAKVLTVFVLPVNSCANPFLYTILTKQFKKDCKVIVQWVNTKSCTRRNSRSVTLSLARQASLRSTMQHQISQNKWRTSGSGSQDVGQMDPEKLAQKKSDLEQVNEKRCIEKSCVVGNDYVLSRAPNGVSVDPVTVIGRMDIKTNSSSTPHNSQMEQDPTRRSSTSPLLEQIKSNKDKYDRKKRRKFSMPLWIHKRTSRHADLPEEPSHVNHDPQRRYSFSEGVFNGRKSADTERKTSSEPTSQNSKPENSSIIDYSSRANRASTASDRSNESVKRDKSERRSPCSPKRLWRQRSPVLKRGADASEIQGLLDRRESSDVIVTDKSDKRYITTVSLEVTHKQLSTPPQSPSESQISLSRPQSPMTTNQGLLSPPQSPIEINPELLPSPNSPIQRPNHLQLNSKSAETLDSGNFTASSSTSEQHHFPCSESSSPITVTPNQSRPTSVSSLGNAYPKAFSTRLDSFSNVLPDSPTETQRRLDKSRESIV